MTFWLLAFHKWTLLLLESPFKGSNLSPVKQITEEGMKDKSQYSIWQALSYNFLQPTPTMFHISEVIVFWSKTKFDSRFGFYSNCFNWYIMCLSCVQHSVVQTCRINSVFPRHWIHCSGTFLPFVNQWVSRFYLTQPTKSQTPSLQHQTPHQSVNQKEKPPVQPEVLWPHLLWKCTQRLTVGLLVAGTGSGATKLLGLAASGVGNQQGPVVLDQDVLDLLLGGLVHIWRTQEEVSMEDNGRNLTRVTVVRTEPYWFELWSTPKGFTPNWEVVEQGSST